MRVVSSSSGNHVVKRGGGFFRRSSSGSTSFHAIGPQTVTPSTLTGSNEYFASNRTSTGGAGTSGDPWDLRTAINTVSAGQRLFLFGGTYNLSAIAGSGHFLFDAIGTSGAHILIESYPGQLAILDGSGYAYNTDVGLILSGAYYDFRILEVKVMPKYPGLRVAGPNYTFEGIDSHHNYDCGIKFFSGGSNCVIRNSRFNDNSGVGKVELNDGGDTDGISVQVGADNILIENCEALRNSDDGIDLWRGIGGTVRWCVANGQGLGSGNGNGFKCGGASPSNNNVVEYCVAQGNKLHGFDANTSPNLIVRYCTAYDNDGYGFYGSSTSDYDNNIAHLNALGAYFDAGGTESNNSWQRGGTPAFLSTTYGDANYMVPTVGGGFEDIGARQP